MLCDFENAAVQVENNRGGERSPCEEPPRRSTSGERMTLWMMMTLIMMTLIMIIKIMIKMIMMNQVSGPARLTLWRSKVEMLQLHYAGEGQYLEVSKDMILIIGVMIMFMMT